jgi:hypothetical protein
MDVENPAAVLVSANNACSSLLPAKTSNHKNSHLMKKNVLNKVNQVCYVLG